MLLKILLIVRPLAMLSISIWHMNGHNFLSQVAQICNEGKSIQNKKIHLIKIVGGCGPFLNFQSGNALKRPTYDQE